MKILVRVLAVIGALAVVAVVVSGIVFWRASTPASETPSDTPSATGSPDGGGAGEPVVLRSREISTDSGPIRDVMVVARGVRSTGDGLVAGSVGADAVVPFETVQGQVGRGLKLGPAGDGKVRVEAPTEVLGRSLTVVGTGDVTGQGDAIAFRPATVTAAGGGGLTLPDFASDALTFAETVPGLPSGLGISRVQVADDGFHVRLEGNDVRLDEAGSGGSSSSS